MSNAINRNSSEYYDHMYASIQWEQPVPALSLLGIESNSSSNSTSDYSTLQEQDTVKVEKILPYSHSSILTLTVHLRIVFGCSLQCVYHWTSFAFFSEYE
jgi:hypothetical protein